MASGRRHRTAPVARPGAWAAIALAALVWSGGTADAADLRDLMADSYANEQILVPDEMWMSGNAVAWVTMAFAKACLRQGWSPELPETLLPDGYSAVGSAEYLWGADAPAALPASAAILLTRSGTEEADWKNGYLAVRLGRPTDANPDGRCTVDWSRGRGGGQVWSTERWEDSWAAAAPGLAWSFERHLSHKLEGFLASPPEWPNSTEGVQTTVQTWNAACYAGRCEIKTILFINRDEVAISLDRSRAL